jgi:hypothetical protein
MIHILQGVRGKDFQDTLSIFHRLNDGAIWRRDSMLRSSRFLGIILRFNFISSGRRKVAKMMRTGGYSQIGEATTERRAA